MTNENKNNNIVIGNRDENLLEVQSRNLNFQQLTEPIFDILQ